VRDDRKYVPVADSVRRICCDFVHGCAGAWTVSWPVIDGWIAQRNE
jgi:hypothetical protein